MITKTMKEAIRRFKEVLDSLECECDPDYGFTCTIHKDKRTVKEALEQIAKSEGSRNGKDKS